MVSDIQDNNSTLNRIKDTTQTWWTQTWWEDSKWWIQTWWCNKISNSNSNSTKEVCTRISLCHHRETSVQDLRWACQGNSKDLNNKKLHNRCKLLQFKLHQKVRRKKEKQILLLLQDLIWNLLRPQSLFQRVLSLLLKNNSQIYSELLMLMPLLRRRERRERKERELLLL